MNAKMRRALFDLEDRAMARAARICAAPPSGHGFRGVRTPRSPRRDPQIVRIDWLDRFDLRPIFADAAFDFGPSARWKDAHQLGHRILVYALEQRRIERLLCNEFTRLIVRRLPDVWELDDQKLRAWLWKFHQRRVDWCGHTAPFSAMGTLARQ